MHLRGFPQYYVKGDERRAVYYTGDARDLRAQGWRPESAVEPAPELTPEAKQPATEAPVITELKPKPEAPEAEEAPTPEAPGEEEPLEFMTKHELIDYASKRGLKLQPAMSKAEMVEACQKLVRARQADGRFRGDDQATADVNEAWTLG